jgi:3',5'-cyclic AMP phosphodiesterase CpdA
MSVLLQISDPHFGTEQAPVVEALRALAAQQKPDLVVLSGDITQRARNEQFAAARAFLDSLGVPAHVAIPGNHDIPLYDVATRALRPYARYARHFGEDLEPRHASDDLLVITVNTTRWYRHKDGEISPEQVERVADMLRAATSGQLRVVVTHQPVCVTREEDEKDLINGGVHAVRQWAQAGADLILGGHIHLPYVCALHKQVHRFGQLPRHLWAVQAGTAVSKRIRYEACNSVNIVRTCDGGPRACTVERWDYSPAAGTFGVFDVDQLHLAPEAGHAG